MRTGMAAGTASLDSAAGAAGAAAAGAAAAGAAETGASSFGASSLGAADCFGADFVFGAVLLGEEVAFFGAAFTAGGAFVTRSGATDMVCVLEKRDGGGAAIKSPDPATGAGATGPLSDELITEQPVRLKQLSEITKAWDSFMLEALLL